MLLFHIDANNRKPMVFIFFMESLHLFKCFFEFLLQVAQKRSTVNLSPLGRKERLCSLPLKSCSEKSGASAPTPRVCKDGIVIELCSRATATTRITRRVFFFRKKGFSIFFHDDLPCVVFIRGYTLFEINKGLFFHHQVVDK